MTKNGHAVTLCCVKEICHFTFWFLVSTLVPTLHPAGLSTLTHPALTQLCMLNRNQAYYMNPGAPKRRKTVNNFTFTEISSVIEMWLVFMVTP